MLHVQVLRSPHAHARIVSIDTSAAEAMEGVEGVITCADVPGEDGFGVFVNDQPMMARDKVRYVGEAVAAVAAEDPLIAKTRALRDQGGIRAAARGIRSGRGDAAGRAGACTTMRRTISPSTFRSASATSRRALPKATWWSRRPTRRKPIEHAYLEPEAGSPMSTTMAS